MDYHTLSQPATLMKYHSILYHKLCRMSYMPKFKDYGLFQIPDYEQY